MHFLPRREWKALIRKIEIPETIKSPGEYTATAKLLPEVTAKFKVVVEAKA